jgi:hypothetical protein
MRKESLIIILALLISMPLAFAQSKIDVIPVKDQYSPGENITLRISLYDSQNNPINDNVGISLSDSEKKNIIYRNVSSNQIAEINIGDSALSGTWTVSAAYRDSAGEVSKATSFFFVGLNELAKFTLNGDNLTITNMGNSRYVRKISIIIGESIGTKDVDLDVGEKISFRLIAPDGLYNVKITDGKTTLSQDKVSLTGDVVGVLDERLAGSSGITSGTQSSLFKSSFVYIFLIMIVGAGILVAIERRYKKKLGK